MALHNFKIIKPDKPRILLIWIGRLGDLIIATPLIRAMRLRFSGSQIKLLVRNYVADVAILFDPSLEVICMPSVKNSRDIIAFLRKYLLATHDICVDLNSSYSRTSGTLTLLSRATQRVSFDKFRAGLFYTDTVAAPAKDEHMLARYRRLADFFKAPFEERLELTPKPEHEVMAQIIFSKLNLDPSKKIVAIHPGNFKKFDHRWPEEKFIELSRRILATEKAELVYLVGPGEEKEVKNILSSLPKVIKQVPVMSVPVLAAFMKKIDLLIVSATGTMHLAAAVRTPMISFHSGYTAKCWRPLNTPGEVLTTKDWNSLRSITVDEAWQSFLRVLQIKI